MPFVQQLEMCPLFRGFTVINIMSAAHMHRTIGNYYTFITYIWNNDMLLCSTDSELSSKEDCVEIETEGKRGGKERLRVL